MLLLGLATPATLAVVPPGHHLQILEERLNEYNETNAVMDLVLFQQAMEHVTRIARIIDQPRLVGNISTAWQVEQLPQRVPLAQDASHGLRSIPSVTLPDQFQLSSDPVAPARAQWQCHARRRGRQRQAVPR